MYFDQPMESQLSPLITPVNAFFITLIVIINCCSNSLQLSDLCVKLFFDVRRCGNTAAAQRTANPGDTACRDAVP